jgi:hypothetical protein
VLFLFWVWLVAAALFCAILRHAVPCLLVVALLAAALRTVFRRSRMVPALCVRDSTSPDITSVDSRP